jgi:hypothetical protein
MHPVLADCSAFSENNVHVFTWKCVVRLFISLLFAFRVLVFCAADFSLSSPSFTQSPFYKNAQFTSPQAWLV